MLNQVDSVNLGLTDQGSSPRRPAGYNKIMITIDDLKKVDIRIGKVISAEKVEGSEKLIKFVFDVGPEERQIIGGLGLGYPDPSVLVGKEMPLVLNLEPRKLMGLESQGMILAPSDADGKPSVLHPDREVPPGSEVR